MSRARFYRLSAYLKRRHGARVFKVSLRGGFSCPNRDGTVGTGGCTFCAGGALEPTGYEPNLPIAEQLGRGIDYVRRRHGAELYVAYFQDYSSTYGVSAAELAAIYEPVLAAPGVVGLAVGTRPDCLPPEVLDLLSELARRTDLWVELGLQIADEALLESINRCHTVADFVDAAARCRALGLRVCAHAIVGLPGAEPAQELRTADLLAEAGVWGVKLHAFHLLEGTPAARTYAEEGTRLLSRGEYVARAVDVIERLPPGVVIHRVTGEAPRRLTVAPEWTINKMAVYDAVVAELERRDGWQGRASGAPIDALEPDRLNSET